MTETQYWTSDDPYDLLVHVRHRTSRRRLHLFAVACCRQVWHLLTDPRSRAAVEVAERHADGMATDKELAAAAAAAAGAATPAVPWTAAAHAALAVTDADVVSMWITARTTAWDAVLASARAATDKDTRDGMWQVTWADATDAAEAQQAALLRCVAGNPWRVPTLTSLDHSRLVRRLAQSIYDAHDWAALPILADALEEAGCDYADVLAHLRGPGPHCRGCQYVDLILGLS